MLDLFEATRTFNRDALGNPIPDAPTLLTKEQVARYRQAIEEELDELEGATTIVGQLDALHDITYFTGGRVAELGCAPIGLETFGYVHEANMRKRAGTQAKRDGWNGSDAVKPADWVGPEAKMQSAIDRLASGLLARRPKVLILGHARHGKDTVAEMLRDRHGYTFSSSSHFCAERVMMPYFKYHGVPYSSVEECYADRVNHRATWFDQIKAYNSSDPSRLAREMLEKNDLYVGMRSAEEFAASRSLFDHVVWVDASRRGLPPEPRDSFDIDFDAGMWFVRNDGTLSDLQATVDRLAFLLETK